MSSVQKKNQSMSEEGDPNPLDAPPQRPVSTWDDPMDHPGGSVSSSDVARPRDKEAAEGDVGVVPGATGTGVHGSQSGRARYGIAPEEERGINGVGDEDDG